MATFLAIQTTYTELQIAVMSEQTCLSVVTCDKRFASQDFLSILSSALDQAGQPFAGLSFIVVNQGPGPFSSLRVVLAAANGLSFASGIPLIGVDGLQVGVHANADARYPMNVYLLNAFNRDVYFAVLSGGENKTGYKNIDQFLDECVSDEGASLINFYGGGSLLYMQEIKQALGDRAVIADSVVDVAGVEHVGLAGLAVWHKGDKGVDQLFPLYLKQAVNPASDVKKQPS